VGGWLRGGWARCWRPLGGRFVDWLVEMWEWMRPVEILRRRNELHTCLITRANQFFVLPIAFF